MREKIRKMRLAYAIISAICSCVVLWYTIRLLIQNPEETTVILACVIVWLLVRMDVILMEGKKNNEQTDREEGRRV